MSNAEKKIMTEQSRRLSCVREADEKDSEKKIYEHSALVTSVSFHGRRN